MTLRFPGWLAETLLLSALVFGPLAFGAVELWSSAIQQFLVFLLLFVCAWDSFPARPGAATPLLLFSVLAVAALATIQWLRPNPVTLPSPAGPFSASARHTAQAALQWSAYAALLWCSARMFSVGGAERRLAWTLFLLGAVIALVGIAQRGQGNLSYYGFRQIRHGFPFGPYTNHNHAASFLVMAAFVGAGLFLTQLDRARGQSSVTGFSESGARAALALFLLALIVWGIIETASRGAIHAALAAIWGIGLTASGRLPSRRRRLARGGLLAAGLAYAGFLFFHPNLVGLESGALDDSAAYRLSMFRSGWQMLKDFPLWGVGLGAFAPVFPAYQEAFVRGTVEHVHNDWLELALEAGLLGGALLAAGVAWALWRALRTWARVPRFEDRCLLGGVLCALLSFVIHMTVEFSFQIPANAAWFFALMALAAGVSARAEAPIPSKPGPSGPVVSLRPLLRGGAAFLALISMRPAVAQWHAERPRAAAPQAPEDTFKHAVAAFQREPVNPLYRRRLSEALLSLGRAADAELYANP